MALSVLLLLDGAWRSSNSDNASVLPIVGVKFDNTLYQFTPFDITVSRAALTLASIMALSVWLLLDGGWRSSDSDNASVMPVVGVKCDNTLLYQFTPFDITVSRAALTLASIMALSVWLLLDGGWRSSDSDNASVLPFNREDSCRERGKTEPLVQCQASI